MGKLAPSQVLKAEKDRKVQESGTTIINEFLKIQIEYNQKHHTKLWLNEPWKTPLPDVIGDRNKKNSQDVAQE